MNKVVMKVYNRRTKETDVIVKVGKYVQNADGVLRAFIDGAHDKYCVVFKQTRVKNDLATWRKVAPNRSVHTILKCRGKQLTALVIDATFYPLALCK